MSFLLGGLVGAGAALLFAPRSGRELRESIGATGRRLRDGAAERGRALMDEARQGVRWQRDRLAAAIQAGSDAYQEEKSQA